MALGEIINSLSRSQTRFLIRLLSVLVRGILRRNFALLRRTRCLKTCLVLFGQTFNLFWLADACYLYDFLVSQRAHKRNEDSSTTDSNAVGDQSQAIIVCVGTPFHMETERTWVKWLRKSLYRILLTLFDLISPLFNRSRQSTIKHDFELQSLMKMRTNETIMHCYYRYHDGGSFLSVCFFVFCLFLNGIEALLKVVEKTLDWKFKLWDFGFPMIKNKVGCVSSKRQAPFELLPKMMSILSWLH